MTGSSGSRAGWASPPGWHGKLPSLGDFASRRLDASFIEPWDEWLAAGLLHRRESQPLDWLDAYLASPSWRFLLMPGVLPGAAGQCAWAGVLMPSVDRVGRYFPFTVVQALPALPGPAAAMAALWQNLARLDELARDALFDDWSVDELEVALAALPPLSPLSPISPISPISPLSPVPSWPVAPLAGVLLPPGEPGAGVARAAPRDAAGLAARVANWNEVPPLPGLDAAAQIADQGQALWVAQAQGQAWWFARPDEAPPRLLVSRGLPELAGLSRLLGAAATI